MGKHLVREDEYGLYVYAGGYVFRPASALVEHFPELNAQRMLDSILKTEASPITAGIRTKAISSLEAEIRRMTEAALTPTSVTAGLKVNAYHHGGTSRATVAGETWGSSSDDPQRSNTSSRSG